MATSTNRDADLEEDGAGERRSLLQGQQGGGDQEAAGIAAAKDDHLDDSRSSFLTRRMRERLDFVWSEVK
jgi:hypothetical protein